MENQGLQGVWLGQEGTGQGLPGAGGQFLPAPGPGLLAPLWVPRQVAFSDPGGALPAGDKVRQKGGAKGSDSKGTAHPGQGDSSGLRGLCPPLCLPACTLQAGSF